MSKRCWRTAWATSARISSHRSINATSWSERFANTGKVFLAAKKSGARSTNSSLRSENDEARMTTTKHKVRTATCPPERSKAKSKDLVKLPLDIAIGSLYFPRNDKHVIRDSSF